MNTIRVVPSNEEGDVLKGSLDGTRRNFSAEGDSDRSIRLGVLVEGEAAETLGSLRRRLRELVLARGHERRDEPFQLSSGEWSRDYIDGKRALASGEDLLLAARCVEAITFHEGIDYEAVGGLTMGADPLAHAIAILTGKRWFSVRKEAKAHGKQKLIEGAELGSGEKVLVVDDVVTTGASVSKALDAIQAVGGKVVLAVTLVDRGAAASKRMDAKGIRYVPLLTFTDLEIDPVGG